MPTGYRTRPEIPQACLPSLDSGVRRMRESSQIPYYKQDGLFQVGSDIVCLVGDSTGLLPIELLLAMVSSAVTVGRIID